MNKGGDTLVTKVVPLNVIGTIKEVPLELIDDNPYQPRSSYSRDTIAELAHSIKTVGLQQIPLARPVDGRFQLAFGHLRKRAYLKLQKDNPDKWKSMPLLVKEMSDKEMAITALEENLRRKDITPIDVARAEQCPEEIATFIGQTVFDNGLGDVRKARGVWQLMMKPTHDEVQRVVALMMKYSSDGHKIRSRSHQESRLL